MKPVVYVVLLRNNDRYHEYPPDLLAVYFDETLAREHAKKGMNLDYEKVPLAPQQIQEEES